MSKPTQELRRWEVMQRRIGRHLSEKLFADLQKYRVEGKAVHKAPMSVSLLLANAFAALIYVTSVVFAITGLILLFGPRTGVLPVLEGLLLLALAWFARPRINQKPARLVSRVEAPTLYGIADRLADEMQAPRVVGIGLSGDFNANYRVAGLPGKRYMELGLQLLAILTPEERVAVMAHELSHGANGDPLRSQFLYGAFRTLFYWAIAVRPLSIGRSADGVGPGGSALISIILIPLELLQLLFSELMLVLVRGLLLLVFRQSQRAEYLADLLAAQTVGSTNLSKLLEKTYLYDTVENVIRQQALAESRGPLLPKIAAAARAVLPDAMEKLRAESLESGWQVDATHPPTAFRIAMLTSRPNIASSFVISEAESIALDAELANLAPPFERQMISDYLETIYG